MVQGELQITGIEREEIISSPLNYTGGKYKILNQILPVLPKRIDKFVDLFCGGCNVGMNADAKEVEFIDINRPLIEMYRVMQAMRYEEFVSVVRRGIRYFGLSETDRYGYEKYNVESSKGLGSYNKESYEKLKEYYKGLEEGDTEKSIILFILIVYGFNNQIRFNNKGEYNMAVGKRDFNKRMQEKLRKFMNRIQSRACEFRVQDFRGLEVSSIGESDLVYVDPPYLVTTAAYNENGGWTEKEEVALLDLLDRIHEHGGKFALSNVTHSNGKTNRILKDWIEDNKDRYRMIDINRDYRNSNYHRKNKGSDREVLVVNFSK